MPPSLPRRVIVFLSSLFFLAGCASSQARFTYFHSKEAGGNFSLLEKVREIEKEDFDNTRLETLARNQLSSHHLVIVRRAESLHYHAHHDGWALILQGEGNFSIGGKKLALHPGTTVFIPRGVPHEASCLSKEPLAAFVIFTPPFDGKDTVPVEALS